MSEPVRPLVRELSIDPHTFSQGTWLTLLYFAMIWISVLLFIKCKQMWYSASAKNIQEMERRLKKGLEEKNSHVKKDNNQMFHDAVEEAWDVFGDRVERLEKWRADSKEMFTIINKAVIKLKSDNSKPLLEFRREFREMLEKREKKFETTIATVHTIQDEAATKTQIAALWSVFKDIQARIHELVNKATAFWETKLKAQEQRGTDALAQHKSQSATAFQEQKVRFEAKLVKQKSEIEASFKGQVENVIQEVMKKHKSEVKSLLQEQETRSRIVFDAQAPEITNLQTTIGNLDKHEDTTQKKDEAQEYRLRTLETALKVATDKLQNVSSIEAKLSVQENEIRQLKLASALQKWKTSADETETAALKNLPSDLKKRQDDTGSQSDTARNVLQPHRDSNKKQAYQKMIDFTKETSELSPELQNQGTEHSKLKTDLATLAETQRTDHAQLGELERTALLLKNDVTTEDLAALEGSLLKYTNERFKGAGEAFGTIVYHKFEELDLKLEYLKKNILADCFAMISSVKTVITQDLRKSQAKKLEEVNMAFEEKHLKAIDTFRRNVLAQFVGFQKQLEAHSGQIAAFHITPRPFVYQQNMPQQSGYQPSQFGYQQSMPQQHQQNMPQKNQHTMPQKNQHNMPHPSGYQS